MPLYHGHAMTFVSICQELAKLQFHAITTVPPAGSVRDLGADEGTVFRSIVLPLVRPAFISSMSYTFVRSLTAVSAVIFLISARWYHMTVLIYNFSENIRFGLASVLATTLIVIVMGAFGLSGMGLVIFGSVAKRIVHRAPCSVMIVRNRR